jgi:hypothetical protein
MFKVDVGLHVKHPLFLSGLMKLEFLDRFSKCTYILNFKKILPVGAELFHEDSWMERQTDMTKLILDFQNFTDAPNNYYILGFAFFVDHEGP